MDTPTTHDHYGKRRFAPILAADNYEKWFSMIKLNFISKSVDYLLDTTETVYTTSHHRDVITAELTSKFAKLSISEPVEPPAKGPVATPSLDLNVFINIERKAKWRKNTALAIMDITIHLNNSDEAIYRNMDTLKQW